MDTLSQLLYLSQGQLQLDVFCQMKGHFSLPHVSSVEHETIFHLVLSGQCYVQIEKSAPIVLSEGTFLMLNRRQSHTLWSGERDIEPPPFLHKNNGFLPVKYTKSEDQTQHVDLLCGRMAYAKGSGLLLLNGFPDMVVANLVEMPGLTVLNLFSQLLREEAINANQGAAAILNGLAQTLFAFALRVYGQKPDINSSWLALLAEPRLSRVFNSMLNEPQKGWTLDSLANVASMSRATFVRQFKATANTIPGEVLQSIRMLKALSLLQQNKYTLSDIAERVGYQSEAAFSKAFKSVFNCRPGQWKKQQSKV